MTELISHPEWLLLVLAPVFFLCMLGEYWVALRRGKLGDNARYHVPEVLCNFTLAGLHQAADLLTGLLIAKVYLWWFGWRLFDIEMSMSLFLLLMVAQDFCYYWFHRASHRVRWMWAAHVVHHSSERMNFSTAFRQSLMYPLAGMWLFWLPLVVIGFPPQWVVFVVLLNLGLQFFVHTQWIKTLGPVEWVFNTPSHHRVHHGVNPQYIDKNYAGILIIWDKLFGTFEPESEPVRYGIPKPVNSFNPLVVTFAEWQQMWRDVTQPDLSFRQRWQCLFAPPEHAQDHTTDEQASRKR
ncbi:sterol desaturase [Salinivibrio kushneri]|uniref:Sterol desaturase n=1 Tax=Salinivibrio kushneri TaxID=1908198 RepID=A0AB36K6J7_9GAMM|nr:sterol desaturase family protein [Salinivibrio kushneri]OOE43728.1 sterol desaturase [Salinivibrio kushneri]OOE46041.1 sterol desaturase [Salinivibrio kushneri]WBA10786.1 sterol desaturase family protein [Salinivibrio kushneri]